MLCVVCALHVPMPNPATGCGMPLFSETGISKLENAHLMLNLRFAFCVLRLQGNSLSTLTGRSSKRFKSSTAQICTGSMLDGLALANNSCRFRSGRKTTAKLIHNSFG